MPVKLFVLGLPGSGKSATGRFILDYASLDRVDEQIHWRLSVLCFNDYAILYDMFDEGIILGWRGRKAHRCTAAVGQNHYFTANADAVPLNLLITPIVTTNSLRGVARFATRVLTL